MSTYEKQLKLIKDLGEKKIKYLLVSKYKGRGRPRKDDYVTVKLKDFNDAVALDILNGGYKTNYTK